MKVKEDSLQVQDEEQRQKIVATAALIENVRRLDALFLQNIEQEIKDLGLSLSSFEVLRLLYNCGDVVSLTPTQLLQSSSVSSGTMTNRLDQLVKKRLVVRQPKADDKRSIAVVLTPAGEKLAKECSLRHLAVLHKLAGNIKFKTVTKSNKFLHKLLDKLDSREWN